VLDLLGTLEAARLPNGDHLVAARGALDERIAGELRDVLLPLAAGKTGLILDMGDVHEVDAHTLAIVACAAQVLKQRGATLPVVTRSPFFRRLVEDAGIADLFELHSCLAEAIRAD
jgi:anti-anti-sigma factor